MMDRDYPSTPRQARLTLVSLAACGVVGILLFGGYVPGLHPNFAPATATFEGRAYYWTTVIVPIPYTGVNRTLPVSETFHNVTFWTWVTNWSIVGGTYLHGNASGPNSTVYPFTLGGSRFAANWTELYVSPGAAVVVEWTGGWGAYLLVLA
jgi:hypothetical protein